MATKVIPEPTVIETAADTSDPEGRRFNLQRLAFGTIQNKIVLPFLLLTVVVTMLGTFIVTRLVAANLQDRLTTQLLETSRAASDSIVARERTQLDTLRLFVFTVGMPEALEAGDAVAVRDSLVALASNQKVALVLALDRRGNVLASARRQNEDYITETLVGENLANFPAIAHVLDGDVDEFGDKYAGVFELDSVPILLTVAPVHNAQSELVGVIAIGIPMEAVLAQTKLETLADLTLYDASADIMHTTFLLANPSDQELLDLTPAVYDQVANGSEDATPLTSFTLNEREYQTAYVPLVIRRDQLGVLGVSWPSTLVTSVIRTNRNGLAAMFSLVAMLVVLVGYSVAFGLTRPIRRLAEVAQAVAEGDLNQQSQIRTDDEIGILGRVFDQMTLNLNEKTEALIQSYQEQERRAAFLSAVIASATDGTVVLDLDGELIHHNPAAEEIITPNPMIWHSYLLEVCSDLEQSGQAAKRVTVDGMWYELTGAPVMTPNGDKVGIVIAIRDITEQVLTDQMRTAFILQMSHELYTPLVAARGFTDLARRSLGDQSTAASNLLSQSLGSMNVLRDLIGQILDISRMIRGGFEIDPQDVNITKLLQENIEEYRELIEVKELKLQLDLGLLRLYTGGREPLRWMFKHLIKNAYDYTLPGGMIRISAADTDEGMIIKVRDTGVGIARHEKPHIFEQFYRGQPVAPNGTAIDVRGAGLGLFVVDQVVRAHGGEVEVWSEPGIGSEFKVRLPHTPPANHME